MHQRTQLAIFLLLSFAAFHARAAGQNPGPVLERCTPTHASANSALECDGFRLGAESLDPEKVRAVFTKGEVRLVGRVGGSTGVTNDAQSGAQSLDLVVPDEITPGRWQLVIEVGDRKSQPVTIEIGEWTPPKIDSIEPEKVSPGEFVWLNARNLHINDEIELTDAHGQVRRFGASGGSKGFTVPVDLPEGNTTLRIGLASKNAFSEPLSFLVTTAPIALVLLDEMKEVGPGQWTQMVVTSAKPLEESDGAEVEFKQDDQIVVQHTLRPDSLHIQVPAALKAGMVEVRTRTLRQGRTSDWSTSISYRIAEHPVPPHVDAIELGDRGAAVFMWEGPDRPTKFEVAPGYELTLRGAFPVAAPDRLLIILQSSTDQFSLTPAEGAREGLLIKLPGELKSGDWKLSISDMDSGKTAAIPVIMHVR